MDSGIQFVIGGAIGLVGVLFCLSIGGAIIGVPLLGLGALVAFSRGN